MSSKNILFCSKRLVNFFRSPAFRKNNITFAINKNFSYHVMQARAISNAVNKEIHSEEKLTEKYKNNKYVENRHNRNIVSNKKDFQIPDDLDPDTFGTLDKNSILEKKLAEMPEEEDDVDETVFYDEKNERRSRLSINQYGKMIKYFLNKKKLGNAIDVLETRMLKEDKVAPEPYIYNLLISGCAKYGYTKKAFQLFNQMKKRGLKPTASTYTSLLNACSTSPWIHDGKKRLRRLREIMLEKGYEPNRTNYHAMIKAYGRCNDTESAFNVVDEMIEKGVLVTSETFNFLLQSCISDKEAGLRHAILVWSKMLSKGLKPDLYSFNLILRCTRDCGLGSLEATTDVIKNVIGSSKGGVLLLEDSSSKSNLIQTQNIDDKPQSDTIQLVSSNEETAGDSIPTKNYLIENRPNLLSRKPNLGDIIGLSDIKLPEHRLLLLGGCEGFLREMKLNNIKPDIKTFMQLLETIPSTISAEQSLLNQMSEFKVQPDIDFFNILIKKRSMRCDYKSAREVLKLIQKQLLSPDIVTFGVLALSCFSIEEAEQLRRDMDELGYRMNIEILGALLRNASVTWNVECIIKIMIWVLDENITPSPQFMSYLWQFYSSVQRYKVMAESKSINECKDEDKKFLDKLNDDNFMNNFKRYCNFYKKWCLKVLPEEPVHPYAQFQKHNDPEDVAVMNTGRTFR